MNVCSLWTKEREDFIKRAAEAVMKRKNIFIYSVEIMLIAGIPLGIIRAEETMMKKMSPYLPEEKVKMMQEMMMTMQPDTIEASVKRGEKLFNDTKLGENTTGQGCNSCHN